MFQCLEESAEMVINLKMKNRLRYSLAGFCMGIAELIPGISGATIALLFGIYKNLISILSNIKLSKKQCLFILLSMTLFEFNFSISKVAFWKEFSLEK